MKTFIGLVFLILASVVACSNPVPTATPVPTTVVTVGELQAQINTLLEQLYTLQDQLSAIQGTTSGTPATVDFNITTVPSTATIDPQNDYTVWQNIVSVGTRVADLQYLALRQTGEAKLQNFRLYVDGTQVGYTLLGYTRLSPSDKAGYVIFSEEQNGAAVLPPDPVSLQVPLQPGSHVIEVVADIIGESAGKTFQFSLDDVVFFDPAYSNPACNARIMPTVDGKLFTARTAGVQTVN